MFFSIYLLLLCGNYCLLLVAGKTFGGLIKNPFQFRKLPQVGKTVFYFEMFLVKAGIRTYCWPTQYINVFAYQKAVIVFERPRFFPILVTKLHLYLIQKLYVFLYSRNLLLQSIIDIGLYIKVYKWSGWRHELKSGWLSVLPSVQAVTWVKIEISL